jgi:selenocysteine lyase/cysteine desulfurase
MLKCQRDKFLLQRKYAYLNCAYMAPLPKKAEHAGRKAMAMKRKPYKVTVEDFFHPPQVLRERYAALLQHPDPDRFVIIPSVSYGMANVVNNLHRKSGKIIVTEGQFPSNVYPWQSLEGHGYKVEIIEAPKRAKKGAEWNERILKAIDADTVLLAIGHVHWADGTRFELEEFRKALDKHDALLIVDGTQSVGALPFDMQTIRPDALVCAAYKWLLGPYSIGMAYYGERFDGGRPIEHNWINRLHSDNFAELVNYQPEYRPKAQRYQMGEQSQFIHVPMLIESINQLIRWTPESIHEYVTELLRAPMQEIEAMGFELEDPRYRSAHLFGIRLPDHISGADAMAVMKRHKVSLSLRGTTIRVAPHVYNDEVDMRKFLRAMKEVK